MIVRENIIPVEEIHENYVALLDNVGGIYKNALFFDLEHYVYKKPICIGVFGCCTYDEENKQLKVTQYMIENKKDAKIILRMAEDYFKQASEKDNKKYIITFSGNNDFTVISYLFKKFGIDLNFDEYFEKIDIQKLYEKAVRTSTGLKNLEKVFEIKRENELISGSNLAKTFGKIMKDEAYILRMPKEKINKILLYNEQDVISLFYIFTTWYKYITECDLEEK
jgi:uncharacterized protein YprB with RNaseH-like and TPR domain